MKHVNVLLVLLATVVLVGCGTQNLPEVNLVSDNTEEEIQDADAVEDEENMENEEENEEGTEAAGIIDELKERNDADEDMENDEEGDMIPQEGEQEDVTVTYTIDTEESTVNWEAGKIVPGGDHEGTVDIKVGTATYIDGQLAFADAVLDMTSIVSDSEALDGHLKNEDFFDVENYPEASIFITSTEVVEDDENEEYIMATADLTIKDITNQITFPVYSNEDGDVANITIDRTLWDVRYGSNKFFDDLADNAIKDEIDFNVSIVYVM